MQYLFIRERWNMFTARLLFKEKSLKCYNWNTQIMGWVPPPVESSCNSAIQTLSEGFGGRKPARKNRGRKGERWRYQRGWYWQNSAVTRFPWIFSFFFPRRLLPLVQSKGEAVGINTSCSSRCKQPTRAQGRGKRQGGVICHCSCWLQWAWLTMGPPLALVKYIWIQY